MAKIMLKFDQTGKIEADALGFKGRACEAETSKLLSGLNGTQTDQKLKPEYNQTVGLAEAKAQQRW